MVWVTREQSVLASLLPTSSLTPIWFGVLLCFFQRWLAIRKRLPSWLRTAAMPVRDILVPFFDIKRQAAIAKGGPIDHSGCVHEVENPDFSLDGTIFFNLKGVLQRAVLKKQLSRVPHWPDDVVASVQDAYNSIPKAPQVDKPLAEFMVNECNFKMEHADGSFMDHVAFCHDYCVHYYKGNSPRVLLLHSIMGVGTNFFPMDSSKIPKLQQLVTPEEMHHIESFPSILRLLVEGNFLSQLRSNLTRLDSLSGVTFRRVMDNKELIMDAGTFWKHLNYHLIHLMDFLPVADWPSRVSEPLFQVFLELKNFLEDTNKVQTTVKLGSAAGNAPTQAALLRSAARSPLAIVKRGLLSKGVRKYSQEIQHDMSFTLMWGSKL